MREASAKTLSPDFRTEALSVAESSSESPACSSAAASKFPAKSACAESERVAPIFFTKSSPPFERLNPETANGDWVLMKIFLPSVSAESLPDMSDDENSMPFAKCAGIFAGDDRDALDFPARNFAGRRARKWGIFTGADSSAEPKALRPLGKYRRKFLDIRASAVYRAGELAR